MANLKSDHPLFRPYRHLMDYGQAEFAESIADFCDMAARTHERLALLQKYVRELEKSNIANSYEAKRQQTLEQRARIDHMKGNE